MRIQIYDTVLGESLSRIRSCSVNVRHQSIQFKVMHRLYYSKSKLHRIYPATSPLCDRCKSAEGSLAHLFWTCPNRYNFWNEKFKWFSDMYGSEFRPDPNIALFGYSLSLRKQGHSVQSTFMYGVIIAKRCILRLWKSETVPTFQEWLSELTGVLERVRYGLLNKLRVFYKVWQPFLDHLAQLDGN